ncbi:cytochrome P450 704C1-like [Arachis stenosperma]|uniref:cytochrome P450 704C1-like n=1 Tax=Arachis stenosperma TaxID=217475 RepID=UPI0025AC96AE|nr:cytochrome P450 704C1-like [Arachis stenosperma]
MLDYFSIDCKYLAAAVLALIIALLVAERHGRRRKRHPVAGTVFHQLVNFNRLHDYMTDLARKHSSYRLLSLSSSEENTSDPTNVEYILKTKFSNYGKGRHQYEILRDLLGDGIFTVDGEKWRHQRKTASYQLSSKLSRDYSSSVFKSNAVKLAAIVSEAATSNSYWQDLLSKSTMDSVFNIVLGVELDTMGGTYEEGTKFSSSFDVVSAITILRYVDIFWKAKRFLNIGQEALLKKNVRVVDEFVYNVIKSKTEQVHNQDDKPVRKDLLSGFLELDETDPKYLKDIILSFIIAGKDTTATTLSWFLYRLCKLPHVQEKIAQEVKDATGLSDFSKPEEFAANITEEALEKMQYLHAALTETLRLHPAVPWDTKICFSDDVWPDGFYVKKGDVVAYQPYAMGRMKSLWGDDAEEFRPERWLDIYGKFQQESPFKFTAFQAGPRVCLGKDFSYRQMKIFSAILLGSYKFKLVDEHKSIHYRTSLTLHLDGGLHLYAYRRFGYSNS